MTVEEHLSAARNALVRAKANFNSGDTANGVEHCREALVQAFTALHLSEHGEAPQADSLQKLSVEFPVTDGFEALFENLDAIGAGGSTPEEAFEDPEIVLIRTRRVVRAVDERV